MDSAKYTSDDIAGWFIHFNQKYIETEDAELISPMKLQKLLYYAQGAFLAIDDIALFDDEICAWPHGPVIPSVYSQYKKYGAGGIEKCETPVTKDIDAHTQAMLTGIYEKYGKYSASQLRNMSHSEPPYINASKVANGLMTKESIKKYFAETVYKKWLDDTLFEDIPLVEIS
jgi:uncharacterized phage-associated protein